MWSPVGRKEGGRVLGGVPFGHVAKPKWLRRNDMGLGGTPASRKEAQ